MYENNEGGSVPEGPEMTAEGPLSGDEMALKGMEIAAEEIWRFYAIADVPKGVDRSDLHSVANETITNFCNHYPGAGEDDLALLRLIIRGELANAVRSERRRAKGVEIPPGANDAKATYETPDWAALTEQGVITRKQGEVLVLYTAGYSQDQIAEFLGITQQKVGSRLERARKILKNYFSEKGVFKRRADIVGRANRNTHQAAEH